MMKHLSLITLPIMEFSKGGGAPMPPPPNPRAEAEARDWEAQQQERRDAARRAEEKAAADAKYAKDMEASQGRVSRGYDAALQYGSSRLGSRGLDPMTGLGENVNSLYRAALDRARAGAPEIVNDANTLFTPTLFDDAYGTVRSSQRSKLNKQLDEFMGDGFEYDAFADTSDDAIIDSILNDQRTEAQAALDRAKARGQVNDVGYQAGLKELGNQYTSGRSKANQLGLGVISNYRKGLTDFGGQQRGKVENYDLGDNFNVDNVKNRFGTMKTGFQGSMEGDILAALGGQNFFNTDTLVGKAGNASGVSNNAPAAATTSASNLLGQPIGNRTGGNTDDENKRLNEGF